VYCINKIESDLGAGIDDCLPVANIFLLMFSPPKLSRFQFRAENILRSHPESRLARELHLSSIEAIEQEEKKRMKEAAIGGVTVAAAVGVAAGIASLLLAKR